MRVCVLFFSFCFAFLNIKAQKESGNKSFILFDTLSSHYLNVPLFSGIPKKKKVIKKHDTKTIEGIEAIYFYFMEGKKEKCYSFNVFFNDSLILKKHHSLYNLVVNAKITKLPWGNYFKSFNFDKYIMWSKEHGDSGYRFTPYYYSDSLVVNNEINKKRIFKVGTNQYMCFYKIKATVTFFRVSSELYYIIWPFKKSIERDFVKVPSFQRFIQRKYFKPDYPFVKKDSVLSIDHCGYSMH